MIAKHARGTDTRVPQPRVGHWTLQWHQRRQLPVACKTQPGDRHGQKWATVRSALKLTVPTRVRVYTYTEPTNAARDTPNVKFRKAVDMFQIAAELSKPVEV